MKPRTGQTEDDAALRELTAQRFTCLVDAEWEPVLRGWIAGGRPEEWAAWTEVKSSTVRTVSRALVPGPGGDVDVHLKLFRAVRLSDRARDAWRGSRATRELQNLGDARRRGLPCVQPLCAGTYTGSFGSRSFLLTRTASGAPLPRGPLPAAAARAAGALLRRAHDAGLHARDLHPGNLLWDGAGVTLLDLTSAVFAEPLDADERGRALALFCLDLDGNVRSPDARPLLAGYDPSPLVLAAATRAARRLRSRALAAFGRRAFRPCRTTEVQRTRRRPRVYLHRPAAALWDEARARIDGLDACEPVKAGRRGAVYLEGGLVLKRRAAAAARRLFESAYWLQFAGVPTPMPVALQTFQRQGIVAVARLPGPDLRAELDAGLAGDGPALVAAATALGRAVGRLHSHGLRNRDLKFENLVRAPGGGGVHMVDLDGVRRQSPHDGRGRAADLGRLLAAFEHAGQPGGVAVVRAFMRAYLRACRALLFPVPHRTELLRRIAARAAAWADSHRS